MVYRRAVLCKNFYQMITWYAYKNKCIPLVLKISILRCSVMQDF